MTILPANIGSFSKPVQILWEKMNPCMLCPRQCKVFRSKGQTGFCGIGDIPLVSSVGPHFGEESVLVGSGGSGTIFFAGCNLGCVFCQNYDISHHRDGRRRTIEQLAQAMLGLQDYGCSKINFVTPTHVAAAIAVAELTIGLILSLARKIPQADRSMKAGKWIKKEIIGWQLREKILGLIGFGNIGAKVANIAKGFEMEILIMTLHGQGMKQMVNMTNQVVLRYLNQMDLYGE